MKSKIMAMLKITLCFFDSWGGLWRTSTVTAHNQAEAFGPSGCAVRLKAADLEKVGLTLKKGETAHACAARCGRVVQDEEGIWEYLLPSRRAVKQFKRRIRIVGEFWFAPEWGKWLVFQKVENEPVKVGSIPDWNMEASNSQLHDAAIGLINSK